MSKKASAFVTKLSQDPELTKKFMDDPDSCMEGEDLDHADKKVLKTCDEDQIREHCGEDGPAGCFVVLL